MNLGFVGLGSMGHGIASNLVRAGHRVKGFNRTRSKADELEKELEGFRAVGSPAEAARGSDVVFSMLADDAAVEATFLSSEGAAIAGLAPGAVHVSMSTISPAMSTKLETAHRKAGHGYVAAPVLGRPDAAEKAQLVVLAAGAPESIARVKPLLDVVGRKVHVLGDEPKKANVVKLGVNFVLAVMLETLGEAIAMNEEHGIDAKTYLDIANSLLGSKVLEAYGTMIAEDRFRPAGFKVRLGLKDVQLALEAAESVDVPMPLGSVLRDRFIATIAEGKGDLDWSAVARTLPRPNANARARKPQ
ncbi:2-hydroxy-3-oxopropionate reductase [Labilithrix luteola]|uniref:2-hydroxy-3-oxopropionate reductase n=1 Tax=Labilithrix luteola TaxID=1391654 RepID=A0A0K1Q227_9BACT|nr:NAD(P)-dependent oxidoreductase [Labilithrix luteola]AKU99429.1 2-hydroxy-3-oxopropionate reductase [Labilithrix luteola]